MTENDDDENDMPEFPILLWIPAICWMLHGAGIMASTVVVAAMILFDGNVVALCFSIWLPLLPAVGWLGFVYGRGILQGMPNSLPTVTRVSFSGIIAVPFVMFIVEWDGYVIVICECAMFLLCSAIGYIYTNAWFVWIACKPVREDNIETGA